jgi:hypothetical protein
MEELKKFLESNENEKGKYNIAESVGHNKGGAKGKFSAIRAYVKN